MTAPGHPADGEGSRPTSNQPSTSREEQDALFREVFGVRPEDLAEAGMDPTAYAREHIGQALKKKRIRNLLLTPEVDAALRWTQLGYRAFLLFVGSILALMVSLLRIVRVEAFAVASALALSGLVLACTALVVKHKTPGGLFGRPRSGMP